MKIALFVMCGLAMFCKGGEIVFSDMFDSRDEKKWWWTKEFQLAEKKGVDGSNAMMQIATAKWDLSWTKNFPVKGNTKYILSIMIRPEGNLDLTQFDKNRIGIFRFGCTEKGQQKNFYRDRALIYLKHANDLSAKNEWQKVTLSFTTPVAAETGSIGIWCPVPGKLLFDNLILQEIQ